MLLSIEYRRWHHLFVGFAYYLLGKSQVFLVNRLNPELSSAFRQGRGGGVVVEQPQQDQATVSLSSSASFVRSIVLIVSISKSVETILRICEASLDERSIATLSTSLFSRSVIIESYSFLVTENVRLDFC